MVTGIYMPTILSRCSRSTREVLADVCRQSIRLLVPACLLILSGCQITRSTSSFDPANASYRFDNSWVTLVDGSAEVLAAPGSSASIRTQIFGEPTTADLNGDGVDDAVVLLTRETGGSGTFFYLAAALATAEGTVGTDAVFLGDRIAVNSVSFNDRKISVRYLTRGPDQSFAEAPTVPRVLDLILAADGRMLAEVARNFEGEADPDRMFLGMKRWVWLRTRYNDDSVKEPRERGAFTVEFAQDEVQGSTDCNSFRGGFTANDQRISFDQALSTTRMFCADSQETEFLAMLQEVQSYLFTSDGRLILELRYDSGGMEFR